MTDTLQCGPDAPLFDLRAERVPSRPKIKMAGKRPVVRDPATVTGVTVHQTAVVYGVSAAQLEELLETTGPADRFRELLRPPTPEPGSWATSTLWLCPSCTKCSAPMVQGIDAYWCRSCEHEEPYEQAAQTVVDARERR